MRLQHAVLLAFAIAWHAPAWAQESAPPPSGARYVAMGSSFAAGPGVTMLADGPGDRCARSHDNYAHQLARRHNLILVDVSCIGATTAHLLGPRNELAPQLAAVNGETRLVTVTIGGNDLGFIGGLMAMSCHDLARGPSDALLSIVCGTPPPLPDDTAYAGVEAHMRDIAAEVRKRAPQARLVFVDYATILPEAGACAAVPLTPAEMEASRTIARRLSEITAKVALETGSVLIAASAVTAAHDACAKEPWINGYPRPGVTVEGFPFHPRLAGMTAIADAVDQALWH